MALAAGRLSSGPLGGYGSIMSLKTGGCSTKHLLEVAGSLLGLLVLIGLAVVLALTLSRQILPSEPTANLAAWQLTTPTLIGETFDSPLATPTEAGKAPLPTATATPGPVKAPTPTLTAEVLPTVPGPFPPGPKVVYSENTPDGTVTFWAASAVDPAYRIPLVKVADPRDFGIHAALSHSASQIAYVALPPVAEHNRQIAELWVVNINGSGSHRLASKVDIGRYVNYPLWSPDDRYVVVRRQSSPEPPFTQTISRIDAQTGEETVLVKADDAVWLEPAGWSSDGYFFYYYLGSKGRDELWSVSEKDGSSQFVALIQEGSTPRCYYFSPDGTKLLCSELKSRNPVEYHVVIVPVRPNEKAQVMDEAAGGSEHYNPICGPRGQEITVDIPLIQSSAELQVIDTETKVSRTLLVGDQEGYIPRSWSPDGNWLAAQKHLKPGGDLYLISSDGKSIHHIPATGAIDITGWIMSDLSTDAQ